MPIRSNLARLMAEKKVTYEDLQFDANITSKTVARARDGRIASCTLVTLEKIASALAVDVKDLFDSSPDKK